MWEKITRCLNLRWQCLNTNMAEFKMAAIIKLSENEWVKFFVHNGWIQIRIASGWVMSLRGNEWRWLNLQMAQIQDGRIQDGWPSSSDWISWSQIQSWSQIELVWVRVRVEWECFWVNLREDNKVSESKMAVSESKMAEFKMAAIIKLSQNEWVKLNPRFLCIKWFKLVESKMAEWRYLALSSWRMN